MILITGCNGMLGSRIAQSLIERGLPVKGYVRESANLENLPEEIQSKICWVRGSLFDPNALSDALEGVHTVIHTAAVVSFSPARVSEMYHTNVQGTATLVNAALASKSVKKFVHISSIAAIGRPANKNLISEDDLWVESDNNTHYATSKYLSELEVYRGFEEGLEGFILNPSVILSPGDHRKSSTKLFGYVLKGGNYYTEGTLNFVDVRDVCNVLLKLLDKDIVKGERFILNAGVTPFRTLFASIASEFGVKAPTKLAGKFAKEILWRVEYLRSLITGEEPLITKETARLSGVGHEFDSAKIKQLFNYQFHTLEETSNWVCRELKKDPAVYNLLQK
jgi:dihydroflavonol-4-reductase